MLDKKSLLITIISLIAALVIGLWLYITFHILFIFLFLPLAFVGPVFGRRRWGKQRDRFYEESEKFYEDFRKRLDRRELLEDEHDEKE